MTQRIEPGCHALLLPPHDYERVRQRYPHLLQYVGTVVKVHQQHHSLYKGTDLKWWCFTHDGHKIYAREGILQRIDAPDVERHNWTQYTKPRERTHEPA